MRLFPEGFDAPRVGRWAGPILFVAMLAAPAPEGMSGAAKTTAAVAALMSVWWITEAVHIAVTALLPLALFPLLGISAATEVSLHFANHIVFLYLGGFIIAMTMERWNLHKRIALGTIRRVGTRPARIALGFIIASAFLSMWISNTATTMMMLPIAMAVATQTAEFASLDGARDPATRERIRDSFGTILLLGIAYAASVGGVGTIIGSPTNLAFLGFVRETYPDYPPINFIDWSLVCVPIVVVFIPILWLYLIRFAGDIPLAAMRFSGGQDVIESEQRKLGAITPPEKATLAVAAATALLWITRSPLRLGEWSLPGWSQLFAEPSLLQDSTVAMVMATLLFLLPGAADEAGRRRPLMDWETAARGMPWGIVFLFGGGFALASAIADTGLAQWIGARMAGLEGAPIWVLVPLSCGLAVALTETTSNIATVLMLSPVIGAAALQVGVHPYLLLIPSAVMASFAFMLPVATPPNAIVFSSGWITIPRMFRTGAALDAVALIIVPLLVYALGSLVFDFQSL